LNWEITNIEGKVAVYSFVGISITVGNGEVMDALGDIQTITEIGELLGGLIDDDVQDILFCSIQCMRRIGKIQCMICSLKLEFVMPWGNSCSGRISRQLKLRNFWI
jgi:hypothetical protein